MFCESVAPNFFQYKPVVCFRCRLVLEGGVNEQVGVLQREEGVRGLTLNKTEGVSSGLAKLLRRTSLSFTG